ncbi:MAG TPA: hypothetical protein VNW92_23495 [Polyangiaceae bacterium]|jgi:hypothetical protein|nr:hypothetical protein [Polyangiaceae bacterium]
MVTSIREFREKCGYSQAEAAVLASVAVNTGRMFEIAPDALSPMKREACEVAVAVIRSQVEAA